MFRKFDRVVIEFSLAHCVVAIAVIGHWVGFVLV